MASGELDILNIRAYFALRGHYPAQCPDIEDSLFSYLETFQGPSGQFSLLPYDEEDLFSIDIQSLAAALSLYQGQDRTFPVEPSALLRQCMAFERTDLQFNSFEAVSYTHLLPGIIKTHPRGSPRLWVLLHAPPFRFKRQIL